VQQPLVCGGGVSAAFVKAGGDIFNKVFYSNIALVASFVTAVGNSKSNELAGVFFLNYSPLWCG